MEGLLASLQAYHGLEVILADGGSTDRTLEIAARFGARFVTSAAGRGRQLNTGARSAAGEILLFLHCDTRLPAGFPDHVFRLLDRPVTAAGAFRLHIDAVGPGYRLIEWGANIRSRVLGFPYGDQALFLRKEIFEKVGGFPEIPFLEDLEFIRKLKRLGRIATSSAAVATSARRWNQIGLLKTTLINQAILAGYLCGISPERLGRIYYGRTSDKTANNARS